MPFSSGKFSPSLSLRCYCELGSLIRQALSGPLTLKGPGERRMVLYPLGISHSSSCPCSPHSLDDRRRRRTRNSSFCLCIYGCAQFRVVRFAPRSFPPFLSQFQCFTTHIFNSGEESFLESITRIKASSQTSLREGTERSSKSFSFQLF